MEVCGDACMHAIMHGILKFMRAHISRIEIELTVILIHCISLLNMYIFLVYKPYF